MKSLLHHVAPPAAEIAALVEAHRVARRVVLGHFLFFLACCVLAVLARRFLKFPPQLTWVVIAVFGVAFAGDLARLAYRNFQLQRVRATAA